MKPEKTILKQVVLGRPWAALRMRPGRSGRTVSCSLVVSALARAVRSARKRADLRKAKKNAAPRDGITSDCPSVLWRETPVKSDDDERTGQGGVQLTWGAIEDVRS